MVSADSLTALRERFSETSGHYARTCLVSIIKFPNSREHSGVLKKNKLDKPTAPAYPKALKNPTYPKRPSEKFLPHLYIVINKYYSINI